MASENIDSEYLQKIEERRREVILEWRDGVQGALDGCGAGKANKSQFDIRSSFSSSSSSSSPLPLPPPDYYEDSWSSKFGLWPWLLRASHSCGNTILLAISRSTSLAVDNCNYKDSINVLGVVDNVEFQWQTWDETANKHLCDPSVPI
ncbi:hypothetical protein SEUCBS139899_004108 [Sporothrix eucalyptigena]